MFYYTHILQEIKHFFKNISAMRLTCEKRCVANLFAQAFFHWQAYGAMP